MMNPAFAYLAKSLFLLDFCRIILPGIVFLDGTFFLSVLCTRHPILCWEIHRQCYGGSFVHDSLLFSCYLQDSIFAFEFWQFEYHVCQCGPLWVPLSWGLLSFLNLGVHFHPQIWEFWSISSNMFSAPFCSSFSGLLVTHIMVYWMVPVNLKSSPLHSSFCSSTLIVSNDLVIFKCHFFPLLDQIYCEPISWLFHCIIQLQNLILFISFLCWHSHFVYAPFSWCILFMCFLIAHWASLRLLFLSYEFAYECYVFVMNLLISISLFKVYFSGFSPHLIGLCFVSFRALLFFAVFCTYKKQPPLPVFTYWICTGEGLCQSAWVIP